MKKYLSLVLVTLSFATAGLFAAEAAPTSLTTQATEQAPAKKGAGKKKHAKKKAKKAGKAGAAQTETKPKA